MPPAAVAFLTPTAAFLIVFTLYSGFLGSHIISGGIGNNNGFQIYGGLGKATLFGGLALLLLVVRRGQWPKLKAWHWSQLIWAILSALAFVSAWVGVGHLLQAANGFWVAVVHLSLLASVLLALIACFGLGNSKMLIRSYKRELGLSALIAGGFYGFLLLTYQMWPLLATVVLHSTAWLLHISHLHAAVLPGRELLLDKFGITVAQYCSGVESIALFGGLYILLGVLDWRRFNHQRYAAAFVPALVVLFGFNILRVYVLILGGYFINPQIAFSLFHTYAGMLFFILYSALFWRLNYQWMLQKN